MLFGRYGLVTRIRPCGSCASRLSSSSTESIGLVAELLLALDEAEEPALIFELPAVEVGCSGGDDFVHPKSERWVVRDLPGICLY